MPGLDDPNFDHGVTLICQHNADGALGININRPTDFSLLEIIKQLGFEVSDPRLAAMPVLDGGPVHRDRGFVIHPPGQKWESTVNLNDQIAVTTSRDILAAIGKQQGPDKFLVALGFASWEAGQLESEMRANAWLHSDSDVGILFDSPLEQRWELAVSGIGIDLSMLHNTGGHA